MTTETRNVWIGCLASYNAGTLHGKWFPASDIREGISEVLQSSPVPGAEEWFIADYDGFPNLGEYPSIDDVVDLAEAIESASNSEAFLAYVAAEGADCATLDDFEDRYRGCWSSMEDYAQEFVEECYGDCLKGLPDFLTYNIDWKGIAHDFRCSGDFMAVDDGNGGVYIFSS